MKRPLRPEEARLWAIVAATVRPAPGRAVTDPMETRPSQAPLAEAHATPPRRQMLAVPNARPSPHARPRLLPGAPEGIEPNRRRRIARGREALAARLDLHGLDQGRARTRLVEFLLSAQAEGARAVLVISGKGYDGEGVLRRRTPEWLSDPRLRNVVAGLSHADTHHGGEGAYYVILKRRGP